MASRTTWIIGIGALLALVGVVTWRPTRAAEPWLPIIASAERAFDIPPRLLARVLHQESRFRPDIISGETRSSAGAVGIAQIVPRWHPDVDPTNPRDSIYYAARYLDSLRDRYDGDWRLALMAYNWGPGNVDKWQAGEKRIVPEETRDYVNEILADVPV